MVRFLFANSSSDCHVENRWEKGAMREKQRDARQESVVVILARDGGGWNWQGVR